MSIFLAQIEEPVNIFLCCPAGNINHGNITMFTVPQLVLKTCNPRNPLFFLLQSGDFQIPPVVESCIDYITVYGKWHFLPTTSVNMFCPPCIKTLILQNI